MDWVLVPGHFSAFFKTKIWTNLRDAPLVIFLWFFDKSLVKNHIPKKQYYRVITFEDFQQNVYWFHT